MCKLCDTECSVCSELRKAGDGERDGQTHDQRRAAGQQVTHSSPLPSFLFFVRHLYPLCSSDWSSSCLYFVLSSLLMVLFSLIRSQDISVDRVELMLPAGIEFRDNCEYECVSPFSVLMKESIAGNYWTLLVHFTEHCAVSAELTALTGVAFNNIS